MDDVLMARHLKYDQAIKVTVKLNKISSKGYKTRLEQWFSITDCVTLWMDDSLKLAAALRATVVQLNEFDNPALREPVRLFDCTTPNQTRTDIEFSQRNQQRIYSVLPRSHEEFLLFFSWMNENYMVQDSADSWMEQVENYHKLTTSYWQRIRSAPTPSHLLNAELARVGRPALAGMQTNHGVSPIHRWHSTPYGILSLETDGVRAEELQRPIESVFSGEQTFAPTYRYFCAADVNDLGYLLATIELGRIKAKYAGFLNRQIIRHDQGKDLRQVEDFDSSSAGWVIVKRKPRAHHWAYFIKTLAEKELLVDKEGNKIRTGEDNWRTKAYRIYEGEMVDIVFDTFDSNARRDKSKLVKDGEDVLVILMLAEKESQHLNVFYRELLG